MIDIKHNAVIQGDCRFFYQNNRHLKDIYSLIYLDPPYNSRRNRGARKYYNDSNLLWDLFMENTINDCYELLNDSGFLAISINQMELFNLKNIVDKIFGEDLFVGLFPIKIRHKDRQLMINATFHDVFEYLLIYRKNKKQRFYCEDSQINLNEFVYKINLSNSNPIEKEIKGKKVLIYNKEQYIIEKSNPSRDNLRKYVIAGKIKTANWSGEWFESNLRALGSDLLIKVYDLDKNGLGYRWFQTQNCVRKSGLYYQSSLSSGRPILPTNHLDFTDIVTNVYNEGGNSCDFKDSKKPEQLLEWIINITTKEKDNILDMFGGSGTTLSVAFKANRICHIIEKYEEPMSIIKNRIENLKSDIIHKDICNNIKFCSI